MNVEELLHGKIPWKARGMGYRETSSGVSLGCGRFGCGIYGGVVVKKSEIREVMIFILRIHSQDHVARGDLSCRSSI